MKCKQGGARAQGKAAPDAPGQGSGAAAAPGRRRPAQLLYAPAVSRVVRPRAIITDPGGLTACKRWQHSETWARADSGSSRSRLSAASWQPVIVLTLSLPLPLISASASLQDAPAEPAAAEPPAQQLPQRAARGDAQEPRGAAPSGAPAPPAPAPRAAAAAAPATGRAGGDSGRPGGAGGGSGPVAPSAEWVGAESRRLADALAAWRASRERKTAALRCAGALTPPPTSCPVQHAVVRLSS